MFPLGGVGDGGGLTPQALQEEIRCFLSPYIHKTLEEGKQQTFHFGKKETKI